MAVDLLETDFDLSRVFTPTGEGEDELVHATSSVLSVDRVSSIHQHLIPPRVMRTLLESRTGFFGPGADEDLF